MNGAARVGISPLKVGRLSMTAVVVFLFGLLQLIPIHITRPPVSQEPPWDSPRTRQLAVAACFDCHSNQTRTFWYEKVAPVSWWIGHHVSEGRQALNFSEWNPSRNRGGRRAARVLQSGSMPPGYYTWLGLHGDAKLSPADRQALATGLEKTLGTGTGGSGDGDDHR